MSSLQARVSSHFVKHFLNNRNSGEISSINNKEDTVNVRIKVLPLLAVAALS